jgi:hypothetical protein
MIDSTIFVGEKTFKTWFQRSCYGEHGDKCWFKENDKLAIEKLFLSSRPMGKKLKTNKPPVINNLFNRDE